MVRFASVIALLALLAPLAQAQVDDRPRVAATVQGFALEDGGFAEGGVCSIGDLGWSFYGCISIALGYQAGTVIATDSGELGARFRASEHVSFTVGVGSSAISAAIRFGSCLVDSSAEEGGMPVECDWTALPLHIYPAAGIHLHAELGGRHTIVSVLARYHVSESSPDGYIRAPRGPTVALGVGWEW
jgi:hypothetical protein